MTNTTVVLHFCPDFSIELQWNFQSGLIQVSGGERGVKGGMSGGQGGGGYSELVLVVKGVSLDTVNSRPGWFHSEIIQAKNMVKNGQARLRGEA